MCVCVCFCVSKCNQVQRTPSTSTISRNKRQEYKISYIYIYKTIIKFCKDYFEAKVSRYREYATGLSVGGSIHDEGKGFPIRQNPSRLALGSIQPPQMGHRVLSVSKAARS